MAASRPSKPATIYDVARAAGVSHQSVSRVLRDVPGVLPATRERVEAALRDLDYRPSAVARDLAYSRRNRIGVVGYESFESSTAKVLKGINEVAVDEGFVLEIVTVDALGDVRDIKTRLESINAMDVVGLLATTPTGPIRDALDASVFRMPVFLDDHGDSASESADAVSARLVLEHLLELGHRRIVHVAGPGQWDSAAQRAATYERILRAAGIEPLPIVSGDWSAASGHEAVARFPWHLEPTAVFVANDRMALGVLRGLTERGLRVPDDLSVAGIDDIPEAEFFQPPLSTVRVDFEESGRVSARALIGMIRGEGAGTVAYPPRTLMIRQSTASIAR